MPRWVDRYRAGEHAQVWAEMQALGAAIALEKGTADDLRAQLSGLLEGLSARRHSFRCEQCKLELDAFEFRCSMCGSWDTVQSVPHR